MSDPRYAQVQRHADRKRIFEQWATEKLERQQEIADKRKKVNRLSHTRSLIVDRRCIVDCSVRF